MRAYVVITAGPGKAREIARAVAALSKWRMRAGAARTYLSWSKSPTRKNSTS